jgi:hypothetical protein
VLACALGQLGAIEASSQRVDAPRSSSLVWLAAGLRLGVEMRIEEAARLRLRGDLLVDLDPPDLHLNGSSAWNAPPLAASLGGDVVAHF